MWNMIWNTVCVSNLFPHIQIKCESGFFFNISKSSFENVLDYKHEHCFFLVIWVQSSFGLSQGLRSLKVWKTQPTLFNSITLLWLGNTNSLRYLLVFFLNALKTLNLLCGLF